MTANGIVSPSAAPRPDALRVEVWSDIACPWCYIGKRRFEAGVAQFARQPAPPPVVVEYRSFELAPDTPVEFEGSEIDFLVGHKQMPEGRVRQMLDQVGDVALSAGLDYDFDAVRHTNTRKAHQLLHYAKGHLLQLELVERLFRAYFIEGRHLGRDEELVDLAAEIGLDPAEARQALRSGDYLAAVRADHEVGLRLGVNGVPCFVIDGRFAISGAQPAETFADALHHAFERRPTGTP